MRRRNLLVEITVATAAVLALAWPQQGAAARPAPPSLVGEHLSGVPSITPACNPASSSTIGYTVSGTAAGGYVGTFTESGSVTMGPYDPVAGDWPVTAFSATFTIKTSTQTVKGSMQLTTDPLLSTNSGFCEDGLWSFGVAATYSASIRAAGGVSSQTGKTTTALNAGQNYNPSQFNQDFS